MAVQVGAHYLEKTHGGRGMLLGGVPGVPGANVVIIGGGVVGTNAAQMALGMGANVTILDLNVDRLRYLDDVLHGRIHTLASNRQNIAAAAQRGRSGHRRRADRGREGAEAGDARDDRGDAAGLGRRRRRDRPGRLHRDAPSRPRTATRPTWSTA